MLFSFQSVDFGETSLRGVRWLSRLLALFSLILFLLIAWNMVRPSSGRDPAAVRIESREALLSDQALTHANESGETGLLKRNPFESFQTAPAVVKPKMAAPPPPPRIPLSTRAANLHLVGIFNGNPPQATIEDKRNGSSATVTPGQAIGEIQVEQILDGKVILSFDGEHMELSL